MLALEFGTPDVAALKRKINGHQFAKWKAFYSIRPFGDEWTDFRFGYMTAQICASFGGVPDGMSFDKFVECQTVPIAGRDNKWRGKTKPEEQAMILDSLLADL